MKKNRNETKRNEKEGKEMRIRKGTIEHKRFLVKRFVKRIPFTEEEIKEGKHIVKLYDYGGVFEYGWADLYSDGSVSWVGKFYPSNWTKMMNDLPLELESLWARIDMTYLYGVDPEQVNKASQLLNRLTSDWDMKVIDNRYQDKKLRRFEIWETRM